MTPLQMARLECPNMLTDGGCVGTGIRLGRRVDGAYRPSPADEPGVGRQAVCLLADSKRCTFFERCILPMSEWRGDEYRHREYASVAHAYRQATAVQLEMGGSASKPCPACGGPKLVGQRYCQKCRVERRKTSMKSANRQRRHA